MAPKKNDKAKLENKRTIFFQIGLIVTLGIVLTAFEWSSSNNTIVFEISDYTTFEDEYIQPTRPEELKPPPPLPKPIDIIEIIPDDKEPIDEYIGEEIEPDQFHEISIDPYIEPPEETDDTPFVLVEDMPKFKGGDLTDFRIWVLKNLRYPEIAAENGISGKVIVQFVVGFNGDVEDVHVFRGVDPSIDKEAVRVVSSSPKWTPGKQRGKPARVQFTFPISFVLQ